MRILPKKQIYFDYAGGVDNPSAIHNRGVKAKEKIEKARKKIAGLLNAHSDEIIFSGSGTESIALALNTDKHIVTTNIEHPAVLENCQNVTLVRVEANGIVDPKKIREAIREDTVLVSVGYANNEIGTIQPIQEIAKEIRHYRKMKSMSDLKDAPKSDMDFPVFHTDACQAMNYLETSNVEKLGVDLLSFNSSKIGGPKGVGVLYKKRGVELTPLYNGGGQEFGLRSGTENVEGIVGMAEALEKVCKIKDKENKRLTILRDYLINQLEHSNILPNVRIKINGDLEKRLPNNINFSVSGISSELLVIELDAKGICVSEKSACHSESEGVSHVIKALREAEKLQGLALQGNDFNNSLRISLGQKTSKKDLDYLISSLSKILQKYKKFNNLP